MDQTVSVKDFTEHPEVLKCINQLEARFGKGGKDLLVSNVLDREGNQYVHLVQKGGGVLGVALVGYTYILERLGIRFIRLAGTSAGAINTALMTVMGSTISTATNNGKEETVVRGNKQMPKSEKILQVLCKLNFFDLVDGHPVARWLIKRFITQKDFSNRIQRWTTGTLVVLAFLCLADFVCLGLQHQFPWVAGLTKLFFTLTGVLILLVVIIASYVRYLLGRLKDSGFGVNPGDFFYDWIKSQLRNNHVNTVTDLQAVASTPVEGLYVRGTPDVPVTDLNGDVTFIASEIVSENKVEFPKMSYLFRKNIDDLQPAGFVRASMSIPIFFESYFISDIPCKDAAIIQAWKDAGLDDPPSTARFVDGGIISNFPINLFFNPNVSAPRLPSFGIDLDDEKTPEDIFSSDKQAGAAAESVSPAKPHEHDEGKNAEKWSLGGYLYRIFNTVRFYYDKDFLIKNEFFKKGIGVIPLKGYNWLNFFLTDSEKVEMFVLGARAACHFLENFDWNDYYAGGIELRKNLKKE